MDINSDQLSKKLLESFNYLVEKIPESDKQEADFIVSIENCNDIALIEAKVLTDDKKEFNKKKVYLDNEKVYSYNSKLGNNNKVSKITSKAKNQLISSSNKKHNFKLIFYIALGINPDSKTDQIIDTIYGRTRLLISDNNNTTKECFYFRVTKTSTK